MCWTNSTFVMSEVFVIVLVVMVVSVEGFEFKGDVPRRLAIFTFVVVVPLRDVVVRVEEDADSTTLVAGIVVDDFFIHRHV